MEEIVALLIPALLAIFLVRMLLMPMKLFFRIAVHSGFGLVCLCLLNTVSGFTGIAFPINAATVLIAGTLGLPGIGLLAVLGVLA